MLRAGDVSRSCTVLVATGVLPYPASGSGVLTGLGPADTQDPVSRVSRASWSWVLLPACPPPDRPSASSSTPYLQAGAAEAAGAGAGEAAARKLAASPWSVGAAAAVVLLMELAVERLLLLLLVRLPLALLLLNREYCGRGRPGNALLAALGCCRLLLVSLVMMEPATNCFGPCQP